MLLVGLCLACSPAAAGDLTDSEVRGKRVYAEGRGAGSPITAYVGRDSTPVPASALPCANCHGEDGLGRPEGGVVPPNITWRYLLKPYGHAHSGDRRHPAFTEETVGRAIVDGVDPAGNRLAVAMPRYEMAETDLADLIAYLKRLETDRDPGLAPDSIRIGTVLPLTGRFESLGQAMKEVIEAAFDDVNAGGGIHGRRLELVISGDPGGRDDPLAAMRQLLAVGDVFALVSVFTAGAEAEMAAITEPAGVPLVGPITLLPAARKGGDRHTFHLFSGMAEQARALAAFAAERLSLAAPRTVVVRAADDINAAAASAAVAEAGARGWPEPATVAYRPGRLDAPTAAGRFAAEPPEAVFFFGWRQDLPQLLQAAWADGRRPYVLLPGSLAAPLLLDLRAELAGRVYLAYPSLPMSAADDGDAFTELLRRHALAARHLPAQVSAHAATRLLIEGLKRAGRVLSRRKFVAELEDVRDFRPGLTPPLSYGSNRRVGARGAYVVDVDVTRRSFGTNSAWIELGGTTSP